MALAHLVYRGPAGGAHRFRADVGTNRYYQYRIGRSKRRFGGLETIDGVTFRSEICSAPVPTPVQTEFDLAVPIGLFDRRSIYIQLLSFRDRMGAAPAMSSVLRIGPATGERSAPNYSSASSIMNTTPIGHKSFCYREAPVSQAMFWDSIMKFAPKILDAAGPILKGLLGGKSGGGGGAGGAVASGGSAGGNIDLEAILKAVTQVLGTLNQQAPAAAGTPAQAPVTAASLNRASAAAAPYPNRPALSMQLPPALLTRLAPIVERVASPEAARLLADQPVKLLKVVGEGLLKMTPQELAELDRVAASTRKNGSPAATPYGLSFGRPQRQYAYAHIAPALLAALPALAQVAQKVLDPKTIEALGNQPVKLFKAINDGLLAADKQEMEHLERLNPGVDDATILPLLNSMSLGLSPARSTHDIDYKPTDRVQVDFVQVRTMTLGSKEKVVYAKGRPIYFPLQLSMRRGNPPAGPLPKVIVELKVGDAERSQTFIHKRFRLRNVDFRQPIQELFFSAEEIEDFPLHRDLRLDATVIWSGNKRPNRKYGVSRTQLFCLTGPYLFDRLGDAAGPSQRLNDLATHRAFWHKVWEGGYTRSKRWEIDFEVKYYYALNQQAERAARLDTRHRIVADNAGPKDHTPKRRKVTARLKSGMELSLGLLNDLNERLGQPRLGPDLLEALHDPELLHTYEQAARVHVEFRGKSGQTAALWAYPEVRRYHLHFRKVAEVNRWGMVTGMEEETVTFPRPVALHFIGTKSPT